MNAVKEFFVNKIAITFDYLPKKLLLLNFDRSLFNQLTTQTPKKKKE